MSIYPTLLELAGPPPNPKLKGQGHSVVPLLKDPNLDDTDWPHYALCTHGIGNHSVRSRTHRYIRFSDGSEELYDRRNDPHEWNNIARLTAEEESICEDHAKHLPENEAASGPSYYNGSVLMRLTGDTYDWKLKKDAAGNPDYKNAGQLNAQSWKSIRE